LSLRHKDTLLVVAKTLQVIDFMSMSLF